MKLRTGTNVVAALFSVFAICFMLSSCGSKDAGDTGSGGKEVREETSVQSKRSTPPATGFLAELISLSKSDDVLTKQDAIRNLKFIDSPYATDALLDILQKDPEETNRIEAARALGSYGKRCDPAAIKPLVKTLKNDKSKTVRKVVLYTLAYSESDLAVRPMLEELKSEDEEMRKTAASYISVLGLKLKNDGIFKALMTAAENDTSFEVRKNAVYALSAFDDPRVFPTLLKALNDGNKNVRAYAALTTWYLANKGKKDPEAVGVLITALDDKSAEVRQRAADTLGKYGDARAVDKLSLRLTDIYSGVRDEAGDTLEGMDASKNPGDYGLTEPSQDVITAELIRLSKKNDMDTRLEAVAELGNIHDAAAVDALVTMLGDENEKIRGAAADALAEYNGPKDKRAVEPLAKILEEEESNDVRRAAAYALDEFEDTRAVAPLLKAAKEDDDAGVRSAALNSLGYLKDPGSIAVIEEIISNDGSLDVKITAVSTLGYFKDAAAVDALINMLEDSELGAVRAGAAEALANYSGPKDPRAVEPLIRALKDKFPGVRKSAAKALYSFEDKRAAGPLTELLAEDMSVDVRAEAIRALAVLKDPASVDIFIVIIQKDPSSKMRVAAANALNALDDEKSIDALAAAVRKDADDEVRAAAAVALDSFTDIKIIEPLINAVAEDKSEKVRAAAANALSGLKDKRMAAPLIKVMLNDASEDVRYEAAETLTYLKDPNAAGPFITVLEKDGSEKVRKKAVLGLGNLEDPHSAEPLMELYGKEKSAGVREGIISALGKLKSERSADVLLLALKDDEADIREAAADALDELGDKLYGRADIVDALIVALQDSDKDVRQDAAQALAEYKDPRSADALIRALGDEDKYVRDAAANALGYLGVESSAQHLFPLLKDEYVKHYAEKALKRLGVSEEDIEKGGPVTGDHIAALIAKSRDADWSTSYNSLSDLEDITSKRALDALLEMLDNPAGMGAPKEMPSALADYAGPRDERVYEALVRTLRSNPDKEMRASTASALNYYHDPRLVDDLLAALKNDDSEDVRRSAGSALGNHKDARAIEPLLEKLNDEDPSMRRMAVTALGNLYKVSDGDRRIVDGLIRRLDDDDAYTKDYAADALGAIGDRIAVEPLKPLLKDENEGVRESAKSALEKLGVSKEVIEGEGLSDQELLDSYVEDLKGSGGYWNSMQREKIIKLAVSMPEPPGISDEARKEMAQGKVAFDVAKTPEGLNDAMEKLKKAATLAPWWGGAYFNLALVQAELREFDDAKTNLELYLLASPDAGDAGAVKEKIYEIEYMKERVEKAVEHVGKGNDYRRAKDYQRAISEYEEALRLDPDSHWAHYQRGYCLTEIDRYDEAIEEYKEGIRLKSDELAMYVSLGYTYSVRGDDEKAIETYEEGLRVDPYGENDIYAHVNLAHKYKAKGEYQKALDHYERASWSSDDHPKKDLIPGWVSEMKKYLGQG